MYSQAQPTKVLKTFERGLSYAGENQARTCANRSISTRMEVEQIGIEPTRGILVREPRRTNDCPSESTPFRGLAYGNDLGCLLDITPPFLVVTVSTRRLLGSCQAGVTLFEVIHFAADRRLRRVGPTEDHGSVCCRLMCRVSRH